MASTSESASCVICCTPVDDSHFECGSGHAYCADCFEEHISQAVSMHPMSLLNLRRNEGRIFCSYHYSGDCDADPFTMKELSANVSNETFQQVINAAVRSNAGDASANGAPFQPNANDPVTQAVRFILDTLLNVRCPSCHQVVGEFSGCGAVQCTCGKHFCCWCFEPFEVSRDAHIHVCKCEVGRKFHPEEDYYATPEEFAACNKVRRQTAISGVLQGFDMFNRRKIYNVCEPSFKELGLNIQLSAPQMPPQPAQPQVPVQPAQPQPARREIQQQPQEQQSSGGFWTVAVGVGALALGAVLGSALSGKEKKGKDRRQR